MGSAGFTRCLRSVPRNCFSFVGKGGRPVLMGHQGVGVGNLWFAILQDCRGRPLLPRPEVGRSILSAPRRLLCPFWTGCSGYTKLAGWPVPSDLQTPARRRGRRSPRGDRTSDRSAPAGAPGGAACRASRRTRAAVSRSTGGRPRACGCGQDRAGNGGSRIDRLGAAPKASHVLQPEEPYRESYSSKEWRTVGLRVLPTPSVGLSS
jgi:hypothetical protein